MTIIHLYNMALDFSSDILNLSEDLHNRGQESLSDWFALRGLTVGAKIAKASEASDAKDFIETMNEATLKANEALYWIDVIHEAGYMGKIKYELLKYKCNKIRIEIHKACKAAENIIHN